MKKITLFLIVILLVAFFALKLFPQNSSNLSDSIAQKFSQKYQKPATDYIIKVDSDDGKFAKGTVNFKDEMGGGVWFAAKTSNGWELAFDGNGIIDCASANKYNFPKNLIPSCLDIQNNNELIQR